MKSEVTHKEKQYKPRHDDEGLSQYLIDSINKHLDQYDNKKYSITFTEAAKRFKAAISLTDSQKIEEKPQPYFE